MKISVIGTDDRCIFLANNHFFDDIEIIDFVTAFKSNKGDVVEFNSKNYQVITLLDLCIHDDMVDYYVITYENIDSVVLLLKKIGISINKILSYDQFVRAIVIGRLNGKYKDTSDEEVKYLLNRINENMSYQVFNYDFVKNYRYDDVIDSIKFDEDKSLFYVNYMNKKMYMNRNYTSIEQVAEYILGIMIEQDSKSPHYYYDQHVLVSNNDIVVDAGVAEGNFALSVIDKVSKIYLIECDPLWNEALRYTFEPYLDKVVFIEKFLSDKTNDENVRIDDIISSNEKIDMIKMDIEGAEVSAIIGARKTILNNSNIKIAACSYHCHNDEILIRALLESYGLKVSNSNGYMLFLWDSKFYENIEFRRGLTFGYGNTGSD